MKKGQVVSYLVISGHHLISILTFKSTSAKSLIN